MPQTIDLRGDLLPNSTSPIFASNYRLGDRPGGGGATLLTRLDLAGGVPSEGGAGQWGFGTLDGATLVVESDASNTYLKAVYPIDISEFGTGSNYIYGGYSPLVLQQELYITIYARMPGPYRNGCKFCKLFGSRSGENYANTTFGLDYTADDRSAMTYVGFGDGTEIGNDISNRANLAIGSPNETGRNGSLTKIIESGGEFASTEWGSGWHKFQLRSKFNSGTNSGNEINDGAIEVFIGGIMRARAINIFNRNPLNAFYETINFFGYSNGGTAPSEIHMRDITVSLNGWID